MLVVAVVSGLNGCSDETAPAPSANASAFWKFQLNQHAVTMALTPPYNTIQLSATAFTADGDTIPSAGLVKYRVDGDTSVSVNANGLVTAKVPTYNTYLNLASYGPLTAVIASLTWKGTTIADTALFLVTETVPASPLATFSLQPPAESLGIYRAGFWLSANTQTAEVTGGLASKVLPLVQRDANGDTITNLLVHVTSSNPNAAQTSYGGCSLCVYGIAGNTTVVFYAQTWYYGVARQDSLQVGVGYPTAATLQAFERTPYGSLTPELYWWPGTIDVTAPASINFFNTSYTMRIDVTFDDPSGVQEDTARKHAFENALGYGVPIFGAGSIAPFLNDTVGAGAACQAARGDGTTRAADSACTWGYQSQRRVRRFTKPGTYTYHTLFGSRGKIVVH